MTTSHRLHSAAARLAAALIATAGIGASASAADMPVYKAPVYDAYSWTGFYIGGHAGYGWLTDNTVSMTGSFAGGGAVALAAGNVANPISLNPAGFIGGGQVGLNWQVNSVVFGVEADISYTRFRDSESRTGNNAGIFVTTAEKRLDWFGTVRGRMGLLATDRVHVYGTGGLAYGHTGLSVSVISAAGCAAALANFCGGGEDRKTRTGLTVGGGVEAMATRNWIARWEYLYYDLGKSSEFTFASNLNGLGGPPFFTVNTTRFTGHIVRAALNYKF
jgi:outer membrane immunogenic protein